MTISVDNAPLGEGGESGASKLGTFLIVATAVVCVAFLFISIWPGWLNDLIAVALLLTLVASPFMFVAFIVVGFVCYHRGYWPTCQFPEKHAAIAVILLAATFAALKFYLPRRIAFGLCHSSFQDIVDRGIVSNPEFNTWIGPYYVDQCLVDDQGGIYFRAYASRVGLGPDMMSYGFCRNPSQAGSPFGAAGYRTFPLSAGWYWFRASDDWFAR
ncbi:MAG: hypothetical protein KF777_16795 [Planctomycetaceae bacterium]|nr:hypothetical protein [Planctomycetaceae bacterium]